MEKFKGLKKLNKGLRYMLVLAIIQAFYPSIPDDHSPYCPLHVEKPPKNRICQLAPRDGLGV